MSSQSVFYFFIFYGDGIGVWGECWWKGRSRYCHL